MRLHPQVIQINSDWGDGSSTQLFFFEGERRAIVDTGVATSPERDIAPYLAYFGYKLSDVDIIINTHGHHDHAYGNPAIPQAEVWIHENDVPLVEDPLKNFEVWRLPTLRAMGKSEAEIAADRESYLPTVPKQKVARVLKDGDIVDLGKGIQLRVIHLPGHTMGSVGYLWEKEGMLFMGDSAMGQGSRPGILPVLFYPMAYANTLQKLLTMHVGMIASAHYYQSLRVAATPIKRGNQAYMYFQDCQEVNNRIMEAMAMAVHRHWQAPFQVVVEAAVDELAQKLYLCREPATGLPVNAHRTLAAYYHDILKAL